jgi:hypothetical protein
VSLEAMIRLLPERAVGDQHAATTLVPAADES